MKADTDLGEGFEMPVFWEELAIEQMAGAVHTWLEAQREGARISPAYLRRLLDVAIVRELGRDGFKSAQEQAGVMGCDPVTVERIRSFARKRSDEECATQISQVRDALLGAEHGAPIPLLMRRTRLSELEVRRVLAFMLARQWAVAEERGARGIWYSWRQPELGEAPPPSEQALRREISGFHRVILVARMMVRYIHAQGAPCTADELLLELERVDPNNLLSARSNRPLRADFIQEVMGFAVERGHVERQVDEIGVERFFGQEETVVFSPPATTESMMTGLIDLAEANNRWMRYCLSGEGEENSRPGEPFSGSPHTQGVLAFDVLPDDLVAYASRLVREHVVGEAEALHERATSDEGDGAVRALLVWHLSPIR